ncbi:MAG: CehA/McbA family metallohydrolase [Eubacterium sp.]|nr:CehA/McbA family metallohydrolase [Eubacterium sp.]
MSFYPCELHCHTIHSDGDFTPAELLQNAKDEGYSLIASTDHNTFSAADEMKTGVLPFIKGIEWTTYFGHMLVLGINKFIDWRDAVPDNIDVKIKECKESGALVGIAHPFQLGSPMCTGGRWEFNVKSWDNVDYIEIWHESFSPDNFENRNALNMWYSLLDRGYHIACTYGRDWHRHYKAAHFGCTYLDIDSAINEKNAIDAVKNGRTVVSSGAKFFMIAKKGSLIRRIGDTLEEGKYTLSFYTDEYARDKYGKGEFEYEEIRLVTNERKTVLNLKPDAKGAEAQLISGHWYVGELWGKYNSEPCLLAVTSPIYCK